MVEKTKNEVRIERAKRNLEEACSMFGWEEHDDFDRALHAKNFLKVYRETEKLKISGFEDVILQAFKGNYPLSLLRKVENSIGCYLSLLLNDKLKPLKEGKEETLEYSAKIKEAIHQLYGQLPNESGYIYE